RGPAVVAEHQPLELVGEGGRDRQRRGGRRPDAGRQGGRRAVARRGGGRRGEGGDVDLDARAGAGVLLGKVPFGQQVLVEGVGHGPGPVDVERLPVALRVERRGEGGGERQGGGARLGVAAPQPGGAGGGRGG